MNDLFLWMDGEYLRLKAARTQVLAHGLHYGTGVFEGIRAYPTDKGPAVFRLDEHMARFQAGADALEMTVDTDALATATLELLRRNDQTAAYIRPLSYFESGGLGLDVAPLSPRSLVATLPWTSHLGEAGEHRGLTLHRSSFRRTSARSVPPLKLCGNYVNSILAKLEATRAGADEALFVDDDDLVCEATGENVFMVKDGRVTAVAHPDALPGITRATVMAMTNADERSVSFEELLDADEVFLTGTSAEVVPVHCLGERVYPLKRVTTDIARWYQDVVHGRSPEYAHWLTWA